MLKALKYRLYPNEEQKVVLDKHFGSVRFVYNIALETKTTAYSVYGKNLSRYDLQVQMKDLKNECAWLKEINSQSLQVALMNLDMAYLKFFKGQAKFPNFKKKNGSQSFQCPQNFLVENNKLYIPKLKTGIKIVLHRELFGHQRNITISKTPTGKYFVSILVEDGKLKPKLNKIKTETSLGVDLGIKTFAVCSDGKEIESPKYLKKAMDNLKHLQKKLSKKVKGSNNRKKAKQKVALAHEKVANQRKDFLHKASNLITKNYDTLCFEDLAVLNMVKNHKLAGSIIDAGWGMFTQFVKYKADWRGKNYIEIGKFEPSSKMHHKCGYLNKDLQLNQREWVCECGEIVQRDINAAINIRNFALIKSGVVRSKGLVELPTLVGAMKQEA